ncbi:MAG: hypothetical protein ACLFPJ_05870 [Candidatus Woesearchaeota archaeon]
MENKNLMKKMKLFFLVLILIIFTNSVYANYIDNAKDAIDKFYLYTKEKDVNSYSNLFDEKYLIDIYGKEYKTFFREMFESMQLNDYKIEFQYYTEDINSLSIFYNLNANGKIDGKNIKIDQDLVAIFTKDNNDVKLRYTILQTLFVNKMNQESYFNSVLLSMYEETEDLVTDAIDEGLITNDEIDEFSEFTLVDDVKKEKKSKFNWFLLIIILLIIFYLIFYFKDDKKRKKAYILYETKTKDFRKKAKKTYDQKILPNVKKLTEHTKKHAKNLAIKIKKTYHETIIPNAKKLSLHTKRHAKNLAIKIKKTYHEKVIPKAKELKAKVKQKTDSFSNKKKQK